MQNSTNMRILELLQFLYERTDENHPATVSDIIAHLNGKGIQAVRQTVYADTNALIDAGIDIVVVKSTQNQYFMGSRLFEYPELKMLTDAVASSKIISARKSEELVQKLCRLTSTHQAEQLRQLASLSSRVKPDNEQVYYIIDAIQTAILEKRQIQFQYYEYTPEKKRVLKHGGYLYQLDPYALEWKNDHYYLIGFSHKHQRMAHFRVDRLSGIKILPSGFTPDEDFDVAGYDNGMKLEQLYDGRHFPCYHYQPNLLAVGLSSRQEPENTDQITWLLLPCSEQQLQRGIARSGVNIHDARIWYEDSLLPSEVEEVLEGQREDLFALNDMATAIAALSDLEQKKLTAVMEMAKPECAGEIRELAKNLELFEFAPKVRTPAEYGRYMIQDSGHYEYDPNLEEFYDYERYGKLRMEKETGAFTEKGYVAYCGTLTLGELMAGGPAEQHQREQEFQMGGM